MDVKTASLTEYFKTVVPDAGTGMLSQQRYGHPCETYPCPSHTGSDCGMCGGSGYRSVCDIAECHEYGCSRGCCGSTKEQFDSQQARLKREQVKPCPRK